ncbi:uracil-DNA glycosylase [Dermatophilaceae bacterium Soc4.6]
MGEDGVRRAADLPALRAEALDCRECELHLTATHLVMGQGPGRAGVMVVGEQPLRTENREGRPFTGRAGMLMRRALADAGIDPDAVFFTNLVKHSRFDGDDPTARHVAPLPEQVASCRPHLDAELRIVRPQVVVLLGRTVTRAVLGPGIGLRKHRGRRLSAPEHLRLSPSPVVVVTARPTTVHRSRHQDVEYAALVRDLHVVATCLRSR